MSENISIENILQKFGSELGEIIISWFSLIKYDDQIFIELNKNKTKKLKIDEKYEDTKEYRECLKMFFKDICDFFGFTYFYNEYIIPQITSTVNNIKSNPNNITIWAYLEGLIYTLYSILRCKF